MLGKLLQGRYQVVQVVGTGGFCQTYLAQDTRRPGHPPCVVKHLKPDLYHPESLQTLRQLFTREAQALEKLGNYHQVPTLLAHFEDNLEFYLVQEFILGHSLTVELQPGQRWSESQVIELLQQVLEILEFVHSHGLIHRDIKPSNLIRRQQDGRLVLIDFGLVKQAWTQVATQGKTCATIAIGTPSYTPIEQGQGRSHPNSDIYALGMISIQALTGLNPRQLLLDVDTGELIWQHQTQVRTQLASVLNKTVLYHFKDRYQSATEVLQALQPLANLHLPIQQSAPPQASVTATPMLQAQASGQDAIPVIRGNPSEPQREIQTTDASVVTSSNKSALLIGLCLGVASALVLMVGGYYSLRPPAAASKVQEDPVSIPIQNTSIGNITLANTLTGHSDTVWDVAISPDGQTLVSSSGDQTIKLWNLRTGKLLRTLFGHSNQVLSVAISPDGQTLTSGSYATEKAIKIWKLGTGELLGTLSGHSNVWDVEVWSLALSPDGQTLVSGSGKINKIWNLRTGELLSTLSGHSDTVWCLAISPDGQTLASGSKDETIKIWHLRTGELRRTLIGHSGRVRSVAISPDGQTLASGSWDSTIKIWHLRTGELLRTLSGHSAYVNSVAISPDGQILASGSDDYTIKLWNLRTGELLRTLSGHSAYVNSVAFDAGGKILVSGSGDKTIKIWQL